MVVSVGDLFKAHKVRPLGRYLGKYGDIAYFKANKNKFYYIVTESIECLSDIYRDTLKELDMSLVKHLDSYLNKDKPTILVFDDTESRKVERLLLYAVHGLQPIVPLNIKDMPNILSKKEIETIINNHIEKIRLGA